MTRNKGIDLTKSIAILCVLFIHAGSGFYAYPVASTGWNTLLVYGSLVRAGVPLFLMCSGALLLDPNKPFSLKKLYCHNLPRIAVAMVFWGILYKLWHLYEQNSLSAPAIINGIKEVFCFNQEFHFYYLHIILLVYILLPVTRVFAEKASVQTLRYALAVWFAFGILYPTVSGFWPFTLLSGMTPQYLINMTYASVGYGLFGWYLRAYPLPKAVGFVLTPVGAATIFGGTYCLSVRDGLLNELLFQRHDGRRFYACERHLHAVHGLRRLPWQGAFRRNEGSFESVLLHLSCAYVRHLSSCTAWLCRDSRESACHRAAYGCGVSCRRSCRLCGALPYPGWCGNGSSENRFSFCSVKIQNDFKPCSVFCVILFCNRPERKECLLC